MGGIDDVGVNLHAGPNEQHQKKGSHATFYLGVRYPRVFFVSIGMAASVGFYAGTFDPPTQAQIAIIRCAFRGLLVSLKNAKKSQRRDFTLGGFGE